MNQLNLVINWKSRVTLEVFAQAFFELVEKAPFEERESSNYVDGRYFLWREGRRSINVALSGEFDREFRPYWVRISDSSEEAVSFISNIKESLRSKAQPAGFLVTQILNFGRENEQRIDLAL